MKVVEIRTGFGLENLAIGERPEPTPGPGQVVLRMRAASLNYRDLLMVRGLYNPKQPLPLIPCSDGVGEVVARAPDVERVAVGDRVMPIFAQAWISGDPTWDVVGSTLGGPLDGTLSELMAVDAGAVVRAPGHLTDEEAAALPCAAVTAWNAIRSTGPGKTVLVLGTGGVAIFALQLATLLGARVIITSSSDEKLERARELGAWETINYRETPEWGKRARKLSDGGVDLVVEVGGAGTLAQSIAAVRPGGRISLIGMLAGATAEFNCIPLLMRQIRIEGIFVGHRESFEELSRTIADRAMRPVISRVFSMAEAREAFEFLAGGGCLGKTALRIG